MRPRLTLADVGCLAVLLGLMVFWAVVVIVAVARICQ